MSQKKKRGGSNYNRHTKRAKRTTAANNIHGGRAIMATCQASRQKEATKETLNILVETAEEMSPKLKLQPEKTVVAAAANTAPTSSTSTTKSTALSCLEKEIETMKKGDTNAACKYFSRANELGCKGLLFLRVHKEGPDPVQICTRICTDIMKSAESRSRFTYRLIPLQNICAAKIDDIVGILEPLVSQYVRTHAEALQETETPVKILIKIKRRNNNSLDKEALVEKMKAMFIKNKINFRLVFKDGDMVTMVQCLKSLCGVAVLGRAFHSLKEFNIQACAKAAANSHPSKPAAQIPPKQSVKTIASAPAHQTEDEGEDKGEGGGAEAVAPAGGGEAEKRKTGLRLL